MSFSLPLRQKAAVAAIVCIPVIYYGYKVLRSFVKLQAIGKQINKFPGLPNHWLYGNLHQHPGTGEPQLHFCADLARDYSPLSRFWFGPIQPCLVAFHPDSFKFFTKEAELKQLSGLAGYTPLLPWLGRGLLLAGGKTWYRNRRLLTPAFHFEVLKPYTKVYNEAADILVEKLQRLAAEDMSVEIYNPVSLCTLNIILRCSFSSQEDVQSQGDANPYVNAVSSLASLLIDRYFKPYLWFDILYRLTPNGWKFFGYCDYVHKVAYDIIHERKKALAAGSERRHKDFLDILLLARDEAGQGLTELEIRQEVDTFLFEGHDTTASAIAWCLYHLAKYPDHQVTARAEVDALLEDRESTDFQWEDLKELPFLTMFIKESMRILPPVPFIGRELAKPVTYMGVELLPGTNIDLNIYGLHHNPHVWGEDHNEFRPMRFSPENVEKMDPYAFVPFSAGSRNCIGQNFAMHEVKAVVAKVLKSFSMAVDKRHKVEASPELVNRAKNGIRLFLLPRTAST